MRSSRLAFAARLAGFFVAVAVAACSTPQDPGGPRPVATRAPGRPSSPAAREFLDAYRAGRLAEATEAFESDSALRANPAACVRAALAYADPAHPERDPRRARELLGHAVARDSGSLVSRDAAAVVALLDAERYLRSRLVALQAEIEALKAIDLEGREPSRAAPGGDPR